MFLEKDYILEEGGLTERMVEDAMKYHEKERNYYNVKKMFEIIRFIIEVAIRHKIEYDIYGTEDSLKIQYLFQSNVMSMNGYIYYPAWASNEYRIRTDIECEVVKAHYGTTDLPEIYKLI